MQVWPWEKETNDAPPQAARVRAFLPWKYQDADAK